MALVLSEKKKKELWEKKKYYREHPDEALEAHRRDILNANNKKEDFVNAAGCNMAANSETWDEEMSTEENEELKRKMCGKLKPRRLTQEEIDRLKKEGRI